MKNIIKLLFLPVLLIFFSSLSYGAAKADLSLSKSSSSDTVTVGDAFSYTLTISNLSGSTSASGLTLTDTLPVEVTYISASGTDWSCSISGSNLTCTKAVLGKGESSTLIVNVTATTAGTVTNSAEISTSGTEDDVPNNNTDSTTVTINPGSASLSIDKSVSSDPVDTNTTFNYTISVENSGSAATTGVIVTDTIPSDLTYEGYTGTDWNCTGSPLTCTYIANGGTFPTNTTSSFELSVTSPLTVPTPATITNTATLIADNGTNESDSADTTIQAPPTTSADLNITKIAIYNGSEASTIPVDSEFQYIIDVTNNGPDEAENIVVTDILPSGLDIDITSSNADSTDWTCSESSGTVTCDHDGNLSNGLTYVIILNVTTPSIEGNITNTVTVSSYNDSNTSNNSASAKIEIIDTTQLDDLCYTKSTYIEVEGHPNTCSELTGVSYYSLNDSYTCITKMTIHNINSSISISNVNVTKSYEPGRTDGTCSTDPTTASCSPSDDGYSYILNDLNADTNITIIDTNTFNSNNDITDINVTGEYTKDGLHYSGKLLECYGGSANFNASHDVDVVDIYTDATYTDANGPDIKTKVSLKPEQTFDVVYLGPDQAGVENYAPPTGKLALTAMVTLADTTCINEYFWAGDLPDGVAEIPIGQSYAPLRDNQTLQVPAFANRDMRLMLKSIDWNVLFDTFGINQNCLVSNTSGSLCGVMSCLSAGEQAGVAFNINTDDTDYNANSRRILETCYGMTIDYNGPGDTDDVANTSDIGTTSACNVNNYNGSCGGDKANIDPDKYQHEYGCLACILDVENDNACSEDNFAIRPDHFDINTTDPDFPNLLRAGEDYNMTIYAHDYGVTVTTYDSGTKDYNQTKSDMNLTQIRYFADDSIDLGNQLYGTLTWSAWDFRITDGISNHNASHIPITSITPIEAEAAGAQYNEVGKINLRIEDRNWAAVDINKNGGPDTPEDCTPDGAYTCGDKNVTYIPHHFGFAELNITNHVGPDDSNFTYIAARRGMPSTTTPDRSPMAARIQTRIEALTKDGNITRNFRADDETFPYDDSTLYYENAVNITMVITVPSSNTNMYLYPDANESNITNSYIGFGRAGLDDNGTRNVLWDEKDFPLDFNFQREINEPANPFDVNGSYLKSIKIISYYVDPEDGNTADINGSRLGDWDNTAAIAACATDDGCEQLNADNNATFYYGRTRASKYFYKDIREDWVYTPITVNVYCDPSVVNCITDYNIDTTLDKTDERYWYLSRDHNTTRGDGNITINVGALLIEPDATISTDQAINGLISSDIIDANITIVSGGFQNDVNVSRGSTPVPPLTVPLEMVLESDTPTPPIFTNEWLIYNEDDAILIPTPFYKVRFIGDANWTGEGQTGYVMDINASYIKLQRLDW